jgi:hypothetical protein
MEPDPEDVKKKLEDIAGRELVVAPEQLNNLRFPVSVYDYADGRVVWHYLFLTPGKRCEYAWRLLDVSGASYSGADGKRVVKLSDVACLGSFAGQLAEPVNVLATARSANPIFVTNTHSLISPSYPNDIEITFFVWDDKGHAAPNVSFDWRCRANVSPPQELPPLGGAPR